jgi:ribosomal protein S18 acetylase RimI-like enzyme
LVAKENDNLIGFVMFAHHVPTGKVTYENGWIHPGYRGRNIISNLTSQGLKKLKLRGAKYICTLVKVNNTSSIKFLEKNKFHKGFNFAWLHRTI